MDSRPSWHGIIRLALAAASVVFIQSPVFAQSTQGGQTPEAALLNQYCVTCHSDKARTGGLSLQSASLTDIPKRAETWEKVIRKVRVGAMPPQGMPRPDKAALDGFASYLETSLDKSYAAHPNPGRASMHRLNRAEYANAVRDLLALNVDAAALLPPDDEASGFDNMADVLRLSPSLMERYLSASWNISRTAIGNIGISPSTSTYRVRPDLSQDQHIDGLPLGTIGGILVKHTFPVDGEYTIKVRLYRNTFDLTKGMEEPHQIEIALDGARLKIVSVGGQEDFIKMGDSPDNFSVDLDKRLSIRLPIKAGAHTITATAVLRSHAATDAMIKPYIKTTVDGADVAGEPAVDRLSVEGPFKPTGPGDTASRKRIFICTPKNTQDELACAKQILNNLTRRAYRRPPNDNDLETLLGFYQRRRNNKGDFEAGIESALQLILASPEFLFRFEADPANLAPDAIYRVSDLALASRLSFFIWSSAPDQELLNLASQGKLKQPAVLNAQVKRMLADPRAEALIDNFLEQWLFLRNLKNTDPTLDIYPDFDDNLRQAMRQETKLLFNAVMREDRSAMDLLNADFTFVNERLAKHYGIPKIYGSQFRRVAITDPRRRGLLGQASILTVTAYPNRTSPVQRGKWILTNLLGTPPTPPPPDVPELKDTAGAGKTLRERMEQHRANPTCAGCHKVMDPIGFSLENFDAIGRWRTKDDGAVIDPSGVLFNGAKVNGPVELRQMLTERPETFVGVMTEKLLTYALGRGVDYYDMPAVRKIVKDAQSGNYRFSALVMGIVNSPPFTMKMKKSTELSKTAAAQ